MKKISVVVWIVLLLITGCTKENDFEKEKIVAINATSYFQKRNDSDFYVLLDSHSKDAMSIEELAVEFDDIIKIYGEPLEYDSNEVSAVKQDSKIVVNVPVLFTSGWMDLTYTINDHSSVTSFRITASNKLDESGYNETQFVYKVGDIEETAVFTNSNQKEVSPLVIFVHDKDSLDMNSTIGVRKVFRDLAYSLADNGIASVRYNRTLVEDENVEDSITLIKEEFLAVYNECLHLEGIDPSRIYVLGYGIGGYIVPSFINEVDVNGLIIASAPYANVHKSFVEEALYEIDSDVTMLEQNKNIRKNEIYNSGVLIESLVNSEDFYQDIFGYSSSFWIELQSYDVQTSLQAFTNPIMITHGSNDYHVLSSSHNDWKEELQDFDDVMFKYYKNMDHLLSINKQVSNPADELKEGAISSAFVEDIVKFVQD